MMVDGKLFSEAPTKKFAYGTSGFRDDSTLLSPVVNRVGFVTALRCIHNEVIQGKSLACGIMITASHNPEKDNGVKIVDWNGAMLPVEWESFCTEIVNGSSDDIFHVVDKIFPQKLVQTNSCCFFRFFLHTSLCSIQHVNFTSFI